MRGNAANGNTVTSVRSPPDPDQPIRYSHTFYVVLDLSINAGWPVNLVHPSLVSP